jgi:hypothetical protein
MITGEEEDTRKTACPARERSTLEKKRRENAPSKPVPFTLEFVNSSGLHPNSLA